MPRADDLTRWLRAKMRPSLDFAVTQLARSALAARCASFVRNRTEAIVAWHLGMDIDHDTNGEAWIIAELAPSAESFVDIGANVGSWSELFLRAAKRPLRGLLLDPGERAFATLERRFADRKDLVLIRAAASDSVGTCSFFEEADAGHHSSLVPGFSRDARTVTVRTTTVDAELGAHGFDRVDFLKIDTEGHDLNVLRGAKKSLAEQRVEFLQFEYNDAWRLAGNKLGEALALLDEHEYSTYLLKGRGLWEFPYSIYGEFYRYSNFVAFPRRRLPDFRSKIRGRA